MTPESLARSLPDPTEAAFCEPLIDFASPDLYRRNAFRVLGLTTSVSLREAAKELDRRRMLAELGQTNEARNRSRLELQPPASADELRAAETALHEPDQRLIHELFWFWPLDAHSRAPDPGLQALRAGDLKAAAKCWETTKQTQTATHSQIAIAKHNLAIRWHLFTLDAEERTQGSCWTDEQSDIVRKAWAASLAYWFDAIRSDAIWNTLSARVIALNDDRLSLEFVQAMRGTVGRALLKINALLALRYSESHLALGTKAHLNLLIKSPLPADNRFAIDEFLVAPIKTRVRQRIGEAEKERGKDPPAGHTQAKNLLAAFSQYQEILTAVEPALSNGELRGLFDEVASECFSSLIAFQNATENDKDTIALLQNVLPLARSDELRGKIESGIATCRKNLLFSQLTPLLEALKTVEDDKVSPQERLVAFVKTVEPTISTVKAVLSQSEELRTATSDRLARALRSISVDAWNTSKDSATAIEALDRADSYAVSPDVKTQLANDRAVLAQVHAAHRREAQTANNKKYAWGIGIVAAVAIVIAIATNDQSTSRTTPPTSHPTEAEKADDARYGDNASGVATSTGGQTYRVPSYRTPELNSDRAAAEQAQARLRGLEPQLTASKEAVEARQRDADSAKADLDRLGEGIEQERTSLDNADENAVRQFNARVAKYNRMLKHVRALMVQANDLVDSYNSQVSRYEAQRQEFNRLVDIYNNKLEKYGTPL